MFTKRQFVLKTEIKYYYFASLTSLMRVTQYSVVGDLHRLHTILRKHIIKTIERSRISRKDGNKFVSVQLMFRES